MERRSKQESPEEQHAPRSNLERRSRSSAHLGAIRAIKAAHAGERSWLERAAELMTRMASSPWFLALHVIWFAVWILINTNLTPMRPFDPFPFGLLTMVVSLEAIFLSIFVLMAQGREASIAELREELTLQVNLRVEAEVTKTLQLVAGLYTRLGHKVGDDPELWEMLQPLDSQLIERELAEQMQSPIGKTSNNRKDESKA